MNDQPKRGFKKKTIVENIRKKMNAWIKTIDDKELQKLVHRDYIITGGAITSMLLGELPNDYDVYFKSIETALAVAKYYIKDIKASGYVSKVEAHAIEYGVKIMIKSAGIATSEDDVFSGYDYFEGTDGSNIESYLDRNSFKEKKKYTIAMVTSNAISLHGDIQLIMRFVGEPEEIHKNYDFLHVTNWFTEASGLVLNAQALESILAKELKYVGSLFPICSMFRIKKFLNRGWTITAGEMLKIAWDINKLNLNDIKVLEEQLIGVDAAYFHQLLDLIKKSDKQLDRTYLFECINRVFDEDTEEANEFHELVGEE